MNYQEDFIQKKKKMANPFVIREGKFKFASLEDSFYHLDWTEESFLSGDHEKEMLKRTFDLSRLKYIIGFLALFLMILLIRVSWLQIIKGEYYYSLAEGNRIRTEDIEPKRGIIYDRYLRPLVNNQANFLLYVIPNDLPRNATDLDNGLKQIGALLDAAKQPVKFSPPVRIATSTATSATTTAINSIIDSSAFYNLKNQLSKIQIGSLDGYQPLFIADNLDYQTALKIYLAAQEVPGVFISNKIRRNYLLSENSSSTTPAAENILSLSHILGYTGKISENELSALQGQDYSPIDYIGKTGVESFWEKELKGQKGKKNIEVDALGREKKIVSQTAPQDGDNLQLAIDMDLQKQVEDILKANLAKLHLPRASVILMDPRSGEILSLVSWPAYDNNLFAQGISQEDYQKLADNKNQPLFNRAVSGSFPAGSTFKPVMASAALQEKVIDENTTVLSTGGLKLNQWVFPDWKAGGHGLVNVRKALADSVNTFFYYVGGGYQNFVGLGIERIVKYSKLFGLGVPTGIDLPNEGAGFLPTPEWKKATKKESWYIGDTYHVSIGQGDLTATPLQVANYTAVIANGGTLYEPHVVKRILDSNNQLVKEIAPKIVRQNFIDPKNIAIVASGMRQTITTGSARSLNSLPFTVAGKTGTAQWSTIHNNQAWFTGFAPYENPEVVVTVLVEEGGEGSTAATPIARDVLSAYFNSKK